MGDILPVGMDELLGGAVESVRLELKASWDPEDLSNHAGERVPGTSIRL